MSRTPCGWKFSDPAPFSIGESAYGVTRIDRAKGGVTIYLRDAEQGRGLNEATLLHEAIHAAIMARYDLLNIYSANPSRFGERAADPAIATYIQVWEEFREAARQEATAEDAPVWLDEPYRGRQFDPVAVDAFLAEEATVRQMVEAKCGPEQGWSLVRMR